VSNEREARQIVAETEANVKGAIAKPVMTLEELFQRYEAGEEHELRLIIKADVQGSIEPIVSSLKNLETGDLTINILHTGTGNIGDNDVMLAAASRVIVLGFNVQADATAHRLAEAEGVSIRLYDIIYRLTEDIEKALKGMLEPEIKEKIIGKAEVRAVFKISKIGNIAGCFITIGEFHRNARSRVLRGDKVIYEGELSSLKHHQEDEREVRQGFECGVAIKGFSDYAEGDTIECYVLEKTPLL
jgi:translation initiation factor IF-2